MQLIVKIDAIFILGGVHESDRADYTNVQALQGRAITVEVEPGDTINIVKGKIYREENLLDPYKQSLLFKSLPTATCAGWCHQLKGDSKLADYDIRHGSTLCLVMRLFAGTSKNISM